MYQFTGKWCPSNAQQLAQAHIENAVEAFHVECGGPLGWGRAFVWRESGLLHWRITIDFWRIGSQWDGPIMQGYDAARERLEKALVIADILGLWTPERVAGILEWI